MALQNLRSHLSKKRKMKKIFTILLSVLMLGVSMMSSCVKQADSSSESSVETVETVPEGYVAETEAGLMFDEPENAKIYNYCPCVIVDGNDGHVWYCSSVTENIGGDDHIAYRHGKKVNGTWYWGPRQVILTYEPDTWYSGNICDPDVVQGEFHYKGETYGWLMAVLGCTTKDNSANMFGFKVAKNPEGPWIDVPEISPLYDFYEYHPGYVYNGYNFIWGWGQCSLINLDKKGKVMLFYTGRSGTGQKLEYWDFSDLENPKGIYEAEVRNNGVLKLTGETDSICNAQFMYDEEKDRFYMISDTHPFSSEEWPTNLPYSSRIYYLDNVTNRELGYVFQYKKLEWKELFTLDEERTGFARNHNCCFYRDPYGWKLPGDKLEVAYTMSETGADWKVLFTYRIYRYEYQL